MNLLGQNIGDWKAFEFNELIIKPKERLDPKAQSSFQCIELEHIEQELGFINGFALSNGLSSIKNKFQKGDTLFGKLRPYLKKYWYADFDGGCSSEIWVLRARPDFMDSKYLFYFVQSHRFIQATNVTSGSKMPRSDWSFVSNFPFTIPPLTEQQKIAQILSTWDLAISTNSHLLAESLQRKKGLEQQLLSGKSRFSEFVKSKSSITTPIGELPEDWELKHISEIVEKAKKPFTPEPETLYRESVSDLIAMAYFIKKK